MRLNTQFLSLALGVAAIGLISQAGYGQGCNSGGCVAYGGNCEGGGCTAYGGNCEGGGCTAYGGNCEGGGCTAYGGNCEGGGCKKSALPPGCQTAITHAKTQGNWTQVMSQCPTPAVCTSKDRPSYCPSSSTLQGGTQPFQRDALSTSNFSY